MGTSDEKRSIRGDRLSRSATLRRVSVVVPCRNEARHIGAFINSITKQDLHELDWEVLVSDGMSDDGTRQFLAELADVNPRIRIIDNPKRTVSCALNLAVKAAKGDTIIRMDVHTTYASNYIRSCVNVLERTGADNVGGPWVAIGTDYMSKAIAGVFESQFGTGGGQAHRRSYQGPVDTVYLGCWRNTIFEKFGTFDENLVRNQDDEFNLRLRKAGCVVWQSPEIISHYHPRGRLSNLFRQYFQYGFWKPAVILKHRRPAALRHLVPGVFVLALFGLLAVALVSLVYRKAPSFDALIQWVALPGIYLIVTLGFSVWTANKKGWRLLPVLPAVFAAYHFGYGLGSLVGWLYWTLPRVHRTRAGQPYSDLTR